MSDDHLPRSVLWGLRAPGEGTSFSKHLRECPECATKLRAVEVRIGEIVALAGDVRPSPALRKRLLESIESAPRLVRYTDVVANLLDISAEKARAYLAAIDEPERWQATPFDGVTRIPVAGGPATAGAVAHFVRVEPGKTVPMHLHLGREIGIFLQGYGRGEDGRTIGPGDVDDRAEGTSHSVEVFPLVPSVMLVVAHGGVRFGDFQLLPGQ